MDVLDLLLKTDLGADAPTKKLKMKRLSRIAGEDVIFELKGLSYTRCDELRAMADTELHLVLSGLVSPDLKDQRLLDKFKAATPIELLRCEKFLRAGEVTDLSREVEKLSGYRVTNFEEIKKN